MGLLLKDCRIVLPVCCAAISGGYIVYVLYKSQQPNNKMCTEVEEEEKSLVTEIPCLPQEIVTEILSYLTVKDFWRCKAVWKQWNTLVQDRYFTSKFMAHKSKVYSQNYYSYTIETAKKGLCSMLLASCDGLNLVLEFVKRSLPYWMDSKCMWTSKLFIENKEAHQKLYIPKPHGASFGGAYAFAFIPCIGEYKVVSIYSENGNEKCAVLTLGSETEHHKWRPLDIPESQNDKSQFLQVGTYFHCIGVDTNAYEITSLDMEKECFTVTNVSKDFIVRGKEQWVIGWNESLAFVYIDEDQLNVRLLEDCKILKWGERFVVSLRFLNENENVDDQKWGKKMLGACLTFFQNEEYVNNKLVPVRAMHGLLWFLWNNEHIAYELESNKIVKTMVSKDGHRIAEGVFCQVPSVITLRGMQTVKQATPVDSRACMSVV